MILPADLQAKRLLDQTLVVLGTEFSRTGQINDNDERYHHNRAFTCLLAGAGMGGGDTCSDNFEGTPRQAAVLDQAMSALLPNRQAKGLLDQMLVVLGAEFGRTMRINGDDGRDHRDRAVTGACRTGGYGSDNPMSQIPYEGRHILRITIEPSDIRVAFHEVQPTLQS